MQPGLGRSSEDRVRDTLHAGLEGEDGSGCAPVSLQVQLGHGQGCRCEVGRKRSRLLDFVALNIYPRPKPGQAKVTVRNINCTYQFPMNDQVGMTMS